MGIKYKNSDKKFNYQDFKKRVHTFSKKHNCKIIFEPGRSIVGDTAILLSKIIYIKKSKNKKFIIIDAGMNDLLRPALYDANHEIVPLTRSLRYEKIEHDFVGPVCETADRFLKKNSYQKVSEGDCLGIKDVGAYGFVLSSNYNLRPRPLELLIDRTKTKVISIKEEIKDLL